MAPGVAGQVLGIDPVCRQAGDAAGGFVPADGTLFVSDTAFDAHDLLQAGQDRGSLVVFSPFVHDLEYCVQRPALFAKGVFHVRRHFWERRPDDDPALFQLV